MSVFIRRCCKTAVFTSFLKVTIPISSFMSEVYNGRFESEFSLSMLKEIIPLVGGYLSNYVNFSMSVFIRCCFKTVIFSTFLQVAVATSNFMNKLYHARFVTGLSVSMLKQIITLV